MGRSKKRRIGSSEDEYTLQLETRVKTLETNFKEIATLLEKLRERDEKIAELEAKLDAVKCSKCEESCSTSQSPEPSLPVVSSNEIAEKDCLIIGDSIAASLDPELLDPKADITVHSVHGGTPYDVVESFKKNFVKKVSFKRILVHFGTNLIPKFSPDYCADNIAENLLLIKRLAGPRTRVQFSGILPKFDDGLLPAIQYINNRVAQSGSVGPQSVCWGFSDNMPSFVGRNGFIDPNLFAQDAIHLTKLGINSFNSGLKPLFKFYKD